MKVDDIIINEEMLETLRNTDEFNINQSISFNESLINKTTYFGGILGQIESFDYGHF